jgi:hypothetical protein
MIKYYSNKEDDDVIYLYTLNREQERLVKFKEVKIVKTYNVEIKSK